MGPFATVEFYKNLLLYNKVDKDWLHPRTIIDSNTQIPSRTRALLYNEISPVPSTISAIINLHQAGADFVVLPCNQIHYWYKDVIENIPIPWVNMLKVVSSQVLKEDLSSPLVLGGYVTTSKKIYNPYLTKAKYPNQKEQQIVEDAILCIKKTNSLSKKLQYQILSFIQRKKDIDSVIFACTELNKDVLNILDYTTFNSSKIYAKETLRIALEETI